METMKNWRHFLVLILVGLQVATAEIDLILVDESGNAVGHGQVGLLIYYDGSEYGAVCDTGFNKDEADAICKFMGHKGSVAHGSGNNWEIQSAVSPILDEVDCPGGDPVLCSASQNVGSHCDQSRMVFLMCSDGRDLGQ